MKWSRIEKYSGSLRHIHDNRNQWPPKLLLHKPIQPVLKTRIDNSIQTRVAHVHLYNTGLIMLWSYHPVLSWFNKYISSSQEIPSKELC